MCVEGTLTSEELLARFMRAVSSFSLSSNCSVNCGTKAWWRALCVVSCLRACAHVRRVGVRASYECVVHCECARVSKCVCAFV